MDIIIGDMQLNRSNPAHLGTSPLNGTSKVGENSKVSEGKFKEYLLEAMNQVNNQQLEVSDLTKQVVTDPDSVDIHDVTTAMAKAKMSLELAQTVIDRIVSGWQELSQNR